MAIEKLVAATIAEIVGSAVMAGVTQVGAPGKSRVSVCGNRKIRLAAFTAVVFTVYVVVVVGTTKEPIDAEPHAAGETLLTEQFVGGENLLRASKVTTCPA